MLDVGIIGTAGRGKDYEYLDKFVYLKMYEVAKRFLKDFWRLTPNTLVSGGAAWADHLAVALFLAGHAQRLTLYLPAEFTGARYWESSGKMDPGRIANYYHRRFSSKIGMSSFEQLRQAIERGAEVIVNPGGFHARNADVAANVAALLAFTFGEGDTPKANSGTLHTWDLCQARVKIHVPIHKIDEYM